MKKFPKYILTNLLLMIFLLSSSVFAAEGDGTGDGSATNRDIALTLESSSVKDNSTDVPIDPTIQLDFNKNICNVTVLSNNKKCFHLTHENGITLPIKLIFPDDQVQHDYRREVFIEPLNNLEPNTTYRISVDSTLMAKNGSYIDNAHVITFTTGETTADSTNAILHKLGDYAVTYETSLSETENSVPIDKSSIENDSTNDRMSVDDISRIVIVAIVILIIVFTLIIIIRRRRRRTS